VRGRHTQTVTVRVRRKRLGTHRKLRVRMEFAGRDATGAARRVARRVPLRRG
jgi:hypothetical protein